MRCGYSEKLFSRNVSNSFVNEDLFLSNQRDGFLEGNFNVFFSMSTTTNVESNEVFKVLPFLRSFANRLVANLTVFFEQSLDLYRSKRYKPHVEEEALVLEKPSFKFFVSAVGEAANKVAHSVILYHLASFLGQSLVFVRTFLLRHTDTFNV